MSHDGGTLEPTKTGNVTPGAAAPRQNPTDTTETDAMIHFFQGERGYLRCELDQALDGSWTITIVEPTGDSRTETYRSDAEADVRWKELTEGLQADGWQGPIGRDARS